MELHADGLFVFNRGSSRHVLKADIAEFEAVTSALGSCSVMLARTDGSRIPLDAIDAPTLDERDQVLATFERWRKQS